MQQLLTYIYIYIYIYISSQVKVKHIANSILGSLHSYITVTQQFEQKAHHKSREFAMSSQTAPSNPTVDPYQHLQIALNPDGTITRL